MRYCSAFVLLLGVLAFGPAQAALPVGALAPEFTADASLAGEAFHFSMADAQAKGPVVLYFYPAAYTRGCDLEAHTFATHADEFEAAGATIIGMSADSIERLNTFSADPDYCAGRFAVASDPDGRVAALYGLQMQAPMPGVKDSRGEAVTHGFLPRTTFVIDAGGHVAKVFSSDEDKLSPDEHVARSLEIVRHMQAERVAE